VIPAASLSPRRAYWCSQVTSSIRDEIKEKNSKPGDAEGCMHYQRYRSRDARSIRAGAPDLSPWPKRRGFPRQFPAKLGRECEPSALRRAVYMLHVRPERELITFWRKIEGLSRLVSAAPKPEKCNVGRIQ
jgi:hypothetical protein